MDRQPHAILDRPSRLVKAEKIRRILESRAKLEGAQVLDVGSGSGFIAEYFLSVVGPDGAVVAVDRVNQLGSSALIEFHSVEGTALPLPDERFDIVIYNHVIEHVGERPEQLAHLQEIRRVLRPDGLLYLAVPNRWGLIEPHFRLPLLSWLPLRLASKYVRLTQRGSEYDCVPLSARGVRSLLRAAGFTVENVTLEALALFLRHESGAPIKWLDRLPRFLLAALLPVIPTLVYIGHRRGP